MRAFINWLLLLQAKIHGCYKPFSYWLHETAACCYSGVDLGNGRDHNSLSRSADGTPYSSPDLPYLFTFYFTLLLPFTWTNYSKSNSLSPFFFFDENFLSPIPLLSLLGQKYSKSNFNSTKLF